MSSVAEEELALEDISWDEIDKLKYYVVGPTTFLAVRAAVYPSNLVKTRLQVQSKHRPLYSGTANAFATILRQEGARGLYKGFGASTANVLTGNLYISVYEKSRKVFKDHTAVHGPVLETRCVGAVGSEELTSRATDVRCVSAVGAATIVVAQGLSGASAGVITGILTNPMDIVRTKAQVYTQYGAMDTLKYILKKEGPMGLMTGLSAVRCCCVGARREAIS
ncbi:unnamed protein product [Phytophthora fragariaefolia]|uniref:Unnamed protein product n=1 Tax=Phytophthora fragariaefolia TaxID=1490495 RepID=A0A9W6YNU3_9STRA|nr:unnamed protein product [Phytophthora fragariaefolia]